jgi:hypothetical protein
MPAKFVIQFTIQNSPRCYGLVAGLVSVSMRSTVMLMVPLPFP